jgi:Ca2+/Na+ antiporter
MTSLLFSIILAALLSATSLIAVLLRVSPLTSPGQAIPSFFASLLLTVTTIGTLLFFAFWRFFPLHAWDEGKILGISLRQGIFLGVATTVFVLFHLLGLLTWWIGVLIYLVFILIELALQH